MVVGSSAPPEGRAEQVREEASILFKELFSKEFVIEKSHRSITKHSLAFPLGGGGTGED